jgi:hypothetical protein
MGNRMKTCRPLSSNIFATAVYLSIGLIMSALSSSTATAADHISITREVLIESGTNPRGGVKPNAIVQTHEGGYVIAGASNGAWAARVAPSGAVQWRHTGTLYSSGRQTYLGAAMLANDSTVLCGYAHVQDEEGSRGMGLITVVDKSGHVTGEKSIRPEKQEGYAFFGFTACATIGDEVVLIGQLAGEGERRFWLVILDGKGDIKFETIVRGMFGGDLVRVMPNNDFVLMEKQKSPGSNLYESRRIVRMDIHGAIKAEKIIPQALLPVTSVPEDSSPRFIWTDDGFGHLLILDSQLSEIRRVDGTERLLITNRAYSLSDGSLVLLGGQKYEGNTFTASIAWLNRDLNQKQTLVIEPTLASNEIVDAVPTGKPGQFATVRSVGPTYHHLLGRDEKRLGVALTFIQIK